VGVGGSTSGVNHKGKGRRMIHHKADCTMIEDPEQDADRTCAGCSDYLRMIHEDEMRAEDGWLHAAEAWGEWRSACEPEISKFS
jgi:hypothetical protein